MKAAIVEKPGKLTVEDLPTPSFGDYECLCEVLFCATCAGTDLHVINGTFPFCNEYPTILGHETVGRVIETGAKVRTLKKGDLITKIGAQPIPELKMNSHYGGFAEFAIATDHVAMRQDNRQQSEWFWLRGQQKVPPELNPAEATMIITWRETLSYITRMGICQGARLLIIGSGGNGIAFGNHARNMEAETIAMIGSNGRKDRASTVGVTDYYDYRDGNSISEIMDTYPMGFDFIIDSLDRPADLNRLLGALKPGGTIGIYGIDSYNDTMINPRGVSGSFHIYNGAYDEEEVHEKVVGQMMQDMLKSETLLDSVFSYSLDEINSVFEKIRDREAIKLLIKLT